jgi:hypothetical protein
MKRSIIKITKITAVFLLSGGLILLMGFSNLKNDNTHSAALEKAYEYFSKNVMPVMKPYRVDFDKNFSSNETTQIISIRAELKTVMAVRQEAGLTIGNNMFSSSFTDSQVTVLKETRKRAYKAILHAMVIADNHEKELQSIFQREEANQIKWSGDLHKILSENQGKRVRKFNPIAGQNFRRLLPLENLSSVMFIVWNPDDPLITNLQKSLN